MKVTLFLNTFFFNIFLLFSHFAMGQATEFSPNGTLIETQNSNVPISPSSVFEVRSNSKGMLPPRMTTAQISAISAPEKGLMAYDTDQNCLKTFDGLDWKCANANVVASTPLSSSFAFQSITDHYSYPKEITSDNTANSISVGCFQGAITFGKNANSKTLTSTGYYDGYIAKHDPDGNLIWATQIAGSSETQEILGVDVDVNGNIAVAGYLKGSTIFYSTNGSSNSYTTSNSNYRQLFIAKYDVNGVLFWFKVAGSSGSYNCEGMDVAFDNLGNVFLTGYYEGNVAFGSFALSSNSNTEDIFLAKLSAGGDYFWVKSCGGSSDGERGVKLTCDASNNAYLLGLYAGTASFGENTLIVNFTTRGGSDGFISKFNNNGILIWAKTLGSTADEQIGNISFSSSNNSIFISGSYKATLSFGPGLGTNPLASISPSPSYFNGFLARYDTNGNIQWSVRHGSANYDHEYCEGVSIDNAGNPYIAGTIYSDSNFYSFNSPNPYYIRGAQYNEPYLAKYNASGALQWVIASADGSYDTVSGLTVKNNVATVIGNFRETINFGYQQLHSSNNSYNGNIFIWRYSE